MLPAKDRRTGNYTNLPKLEFMVFPRKYMPSDLDPWNPPIVVRVQNIPQDELLSEQEKQTREKQQQKGKGQEKQQNPKHWGLRLSIIKASPEEHLKPRQREIETVEPVEINFGMMSHDKIKNYGFATFKKLLLDEEFSEQQAATNPQLPIARKCYRFRVECFKMVESATIPVTWIDSDAFEITDNKSLLHLKEWNESEQATLYFVRPTENFDWPHWVGSMWPPAWHHYTSILGYRYSQYYD
ncbi:hypothetical protein F5Y18DRAFT_206276 [Xylariaceae sp. FL1019]|nr:hypothetical protein F5Y18DRAFT_206276 [Xylariaceae sp. FL1019]